MKAWHRLTMDHGLAAPVLQLTAAQRHLRETLGGGRFILDPVTAHPGHMRRITVHEDNTVDMVGLDPWHDGWYDLGGPTPRDVIAGRPL